MPFLNSSIGLFFFFPIYSDKSLLPISCAMKQLYVCVFLDCSYENSPDSDILRNNIFIWGLTVSRWRHHGTYQNLPNAPGDIRIITWIGYMRSKYIMWWKVTIRFHTTKWNHVCKIRTCCILCCCLRAVHVNKTEHGFRRERKWEQL